MNKIQDISKLIATNKWFEFAIIGIIIINSVLIGVETYTYNPNIVLVQHIILYIFTFEIAVRFIAAQNIRIFFTNGWNIFDLTLVIIGYIPETLVDNASMMMALRVLRVFRVLRLLRTAKEIKVIITVLIRSFSAMFYNVILFVIFIYLYAIIGVGLFKLPNPDQLTGEDWTDLRYNHITASNLGVIKVNPTVINIYHISWFVIAVFLLLNLVTGAIINNYQTVKEENDLKEKQKE